jgi:hypothetical protein
MDGYARGVSRDSLRPPLAGVGTAAALNAASTGATGARSTGVTGALGTGAVATSFLSAYPLSDASEIERYSLATGQKLGVLVDIPAFKGRAQSSSVSTPHLLPDGAYMLTLGHGDACGNARGRCHPVPNSCASEVESLNPVTRQAQTLFTVSGAWRVSDAVPSPDGGSVALFEYGCHGNATQLEVRDLATGQTQLVARDLSSCGVNSDVAWNPTSTALVFAYARHPNVNITPVGCGLATAPADRTTRPASWATLHVQTSCGFDSAAFDAKGIVAIIACTDKYGGLTSTLVQYGSHGQLLAHHGLDSFDPPQYGLATQLQSDPAVGGVLASEIITNDPDVSDVWTFNGTKLRHVGNYFGDAILAEP